MTVLANPGSADVDLDLESLVALYGDLIADSNIGATGIRINPTPLGLRRCHVRVPGLGEGRPRGFIVHTPAAVRAEVVRGSTRQWFPDTPAMGVEPELVVLRHHPAVYFAGAYSSVTALMPGPRPLTRLLTGVAAALVWVSVGRPGVVRYIDARAPISLCATPLALIKQQQSAGLRTRLRPCLPRSNTLNSAPAATRSSRWFNVWTAGRLDPTDDVGAASRT